MNIGIVTTWFERGAAYVSKQYMDVLNKEHDVFIYARGGESEGKSDPQWNLENVWWGKSFNSVTTKISIKDLKKWVSENKIDVVLFNEQHIWYPIIELNKMGVKTGAYIDFYTSDMVELFGSYDFLICNTKRHYSVFDWHPQSYYVPWGTLPELYKPRQNDKNDEQIVFFHSAGMNPLRKGTDVLINAANHLEAKEEEFKVLIHTQVNLIDFFPKLSDIIKKLIRVGKLEVITQNVSAPGLYFLGDIYVYPSRLDGIGLTVPEAISSGLPSIVTDEPPMNEFVKKDINGRLIRVENKKYRNDNYYWQMVEPETESLAKQMKYYLDNSNQLEYNKSKAREYAIEKLNWWSNANELNKIFKNTKLLNNSALKHDSLEKALRYEKNRSILYYVKGYKPYIKFKNRIKRVFGV
ncbi:glycosyltransferase family 4 protein [Salinivirga cyanobacteriivorans]